MIPRLSHDLVNELPEVKGFSERNIKQMLAFHRAYPDPSAIVQQAVAQLPGPAIWPQAVAKLPTDTPEQKGPRSVAQLALSHPANPLLQQAVAKLSEVHNVLIQKTKDLRRGRPKVHPMKRPNRTYVPVS